MTSTNFDMFYESSAVTRSPTSQRQGTLHRQSSRPQFDQQAYGHLPSGLYNGEDHVAPPRYDSTRFDPSRNTIGGYGSTSYESGHSWNPAAFSSNGTLNGLGTASLRKPPSRGGRSGLPASWLDQPQPVPMAAPLGGLGLGGGMMRSDGMSAEPDEELIPTAIVIKNIPFAIKKEQLVSIMTDMGLPLPYAFNYHFDNGVFRGLAFANFTNPDETAAVINSMNHLELHGRKLRVEYKKMLPAAERERIEREKRERRGQLEEQHRPVASQAAALHTHGSMSSLSSRIHTHSPSPVSARNNMGLDVDLNDPQALQFYSKLLLFKEDGARDLVVFPSTLSPPERRIVHTLAHHMGLGHSSKGEADRRAVHVFKDTGRARVSPPMPQIATLRNEERRALNRAATTDFSDVRGDGAGFYMGPLRHQGSGTYLGAYPDSVTGLGPGNNLRAAKSFADLRSYTPSPVPSTASFPAALTNNVARLQDFGRDGGLIGTPTLMTPTSGLADRGETGLINGLGNMNLGNNTGNSGNSNGVNASNQPSGFGGSPRGLRGLPSWERDLPPGTIGGHRSFSSAFDDRSAQSRLQAASGTGPERQPRGPLPERGAGFPRPGRQNGHVSRTSDDLSQQSSPQEIVVEH